MSNNIFINADEALQRLESLMESTCVKYNLVTCKDKNKQGVFYTAQMTFTTRTGVDGYIGGLDGTSFPDLYDKLYTQLANHKAFK